MEHILVSALTSVLASTAVLLAAGRFLGERLFGHWLEGRLQSQKEAHEVRLAELKSEQDRQIEKLRGDIGHLQDRGKHSNEREYAALTGIWEKYADLHAATDNYVGGVGQGDWAESAYVDFRVLFAKQNVFIPKALADSFREAADRCMRTIAWRKVDEAGRRPAGMAGANGFLEMGPQTLIMLNDAVRERLHRE